MFREGIPQAKGGGAKGSISNGAAISPRGEEMMGACGAEGTC